VNIRPYQYEGTNFLAARQHALLAWDMRLGKSMAAIRAAMQCGARRVLVLCPAVVRPNWAREFGKWAWPHEVVTLTSGMQDVPFGPAAVVTSYEIASTERMGAILRLDDWDVLIADESHYLKTRDSRRTRAVFDSRRGLARSAGRVWALSGTPAPNHIGELWVLMRCFGLTDKDYDGFIRAYCDLSWDGRPVGTSAAMVPYLRAMLAPVMQRLKRSDVAPDLPPVNFLQQTVEATPTLPADFPELPPGEEVLTWLAHNTEHAATLRRALGVAKAPAVAQQLAFELESDPARKILVGAHHREVVDILTAKLAPFGVVTITGDSTETQKVAAQDAFQRGPACRVCIGNIRAAGVGIDLSAADDVAFAEYSWVPADNVQFAARAQGFDKKRQVTATYFSTPNSLDDRITAALVRKSADFAAVFDGVALGWYNRTT